MEKEVLHFIQEAKKAIKEKRPGSYINNYCYFLKNNNVLALRNPVGDSRYPYTVDGLTLWTYASGNITLNQSNFFIVPPTIEGKEPYMNFYGGIKNKDRYDVFSLTGNADTEYGVAQEMYTIFTPSYCYYIRKIKGIIFAVKLTINKEKKVLLSSCVINNTGKKIEAFISLYFNPLIIHSSTEDEETKWFRTVKLEGDNAVFSSVEDISREVHLNNYLLLKTQQNGDKKDVSVRRMDYVGDKNRSISQSTCLRAGEFKNHQPTATFVDMAIYGDINQKVIPAHQSLECNYQIQIALDEKELNKLKQETLLPHENEKLFLENEKSIKKDIQISFSDFKTKNLNNEIFNNFLSSVINQVDYASKTKNSSLMLLGIRDVYQMLEVSLVWDKDNARKKILESLSFLDPSGRAPRQYTTEVKGKKLLMDNREFIDQGQWIISTIWKYLAFTNDYSLLKEKCGYCKLLDRRNGEILEEQDSVYDHLVKIINFLISNIDEETSCLKTLYGDWNDAVDGLGSSETQRFGNGVSVMATCHLYQNLLEMEDIRNIVKDSKDPQYLKIAEQVDRGILDNALIEQEGKRRIVHGWGENRSFYVGSFDDVDHKSRYSATSNAFFALSGLLKVHPEYHIDIIEAADALDGKYGIRTFNEYFDKKDASRVGRIVNLPKGTAENGATYIHAGMFFARALFQMKEGKKAFEQIYKLIPITHEKITTSPFVMPNSYGYNEDLFIDGESMSDWYTGSSNTLLKAVIFDMFGVKPQIGDELIVNPTDYFPSQTANIALTIKGKKVSITYKNENNHQRKIYVNGTQVESNHINLKQYKGRLNIDIID